MSEIKEKREVEVVVGIVCDVCGKDCRTDEKYDCSSEYGEISASWGYFSTRDGEQWNCHLCQDCFERVVEYVESIGGKFRTKNTLTNSFAKLFRAKKF